MSFLPYFIVSSVILIAFVLWGAPILPIRRVVRTRIIRADRDCVWRALGRHRGSLCGDRAHYEPRSMTEGKRYEGLIVGTHGLDFVPQARIVEIVTLDDQAEGTQVTVSQERGTAQSLAMYLAQRRALYALLDNITAACEGDDLGQQAAQVGVEATGGVQQRAAFNLGLTVLSVGLIGYFINWRLAALLVAATFVHEIGHWFAFRIAGHPSPRIIPMPFVGCAVASDRPFRSAREEAFVSLMGPGVSAVFALLLLGIAHGMGADLTALLGTTPSVAYVDANISAILVVVASALVGAANLFQMIPVPPLDGGCIWRALLHGKRRWFVRYVFPLLAAGLVWGAYHVGGTFLALAFALLCLVWPAAISQHLAVPVMAPRQKLVVAIAYVAVAAAHILPIFVVARTFI